MCTTLPEIETAKKVNPYHFILVDDKQKTLYCAVSKCASTTWKYVLLRSHRAYIKPGSMGVHNRDHIKKVGLVFLEDFSKEEAEHKLKTYFKYMIVRHPLSRLLSAYRDKLIISSETNYKRHIGAVVRKYIREKTCPNKADSSVTFREFVKYLLRISPQAYDRHWLSIYHHCHPCHIHYDYIAKVEYLDTEAEELLKLMNVTVPKVPFSNRHQMNKEEFIQYYSNISLAEYHDILNIYSKDMNMFDYRDPFRFNKSIDK